VNGALRHASDGTATKAGGRLIAVGLAVVVAGATAAAPVRVRAASPSVASVWNEYASVLSSVVDEHGAVDYPRLVRGRAALDRVVRAVAAVDSAVLARSGEDEQVAFWINAYNALTLRLIVDHYPLGELPVRDPDSPRNSIRQIAGAWDGVEFTVAGERMTLDHLENAVLRARFAEPRIHMALVCAARSCPPLRAEPYTGVRLEEQLADQARKFLSDPARFAVDRAAGVVKLSPIFDWFAGDFATRYGKNSNPAVDKRLRGVIDFVATYAPDDAARWLRTARYRVEFLPYDWTLNESAAGSNRHAN